MRLMEMLPRIRRDAQRTQIADLLVNGDPSRGVAPIAFWYPSRTQVFWTENHYAMHVVAEFVLRRSFESDDTILASTLYTRLYTYVDMKARIGFSEFLSPVYQPFTLAALINLYDELVSPSTVSFRDLRQKCVQALNNAASAFLSVTLVTDDDDITMIAPAGREYERHRLTTRNTHIGHFLSFILNGPFGEVYISRVKKAGEEGQALYQALLTTQFAFMRPVPFASSPSFIEKTLTPSLIELVSFLDRHTDITDDVYVTLMWTYGVYVIPSMHYLRRVNRMMHTKAVWSHNHFKGMAWVSYIPFFLSLLILLFSVSLVIFFDLATWYVGATLAVYREEGCVMSSLRHFRPGLAPAQQWPWAVNVNGVPVWCAYGNASALGGVKGVGNKEASGETSSARVLPLIHHDGSLLYAHYTASSRMVWLWLRRLRPEMHWPRKGTHTDSRLCFDDDGRYRYQRDVWFWGRKKNSVVMYAIRDRRVLVHVTTLSSSPYRGWVKDVHDALLTKIKASPVIAKAWSA